MGNVKKNGNYNNKDGNVQLMTVQNNYITQQTKRITSNCSVIIGTWRNDISGNRDIGNMTFVDLTWGSAER